jgi:hypothetical protein
MEFLKLLGSTKAWELVVALVGGYLAAKNMEKLSRFGMLIYITIAIVIGFCFTDFALPYLVETERLSTPASENLRPLSLVLSSAGSLKMIDVGLGWIARLKDLEISWSWFKK